MEKREVVTAFLRHEGQILLLKRSEKNSTYQGQWGGVSGYLEVDGAFLLQARQEISEETGLHDEDLALVCDGEPIEVPAPELNTCWVVHPFLFDVSNPDSISLDEESDAYQWIKAEEIHGLSTVPALIKALARCLERERGATH